MRRILSFCLIIAPALPGADKWIRVASPNFEVFTTQSERRARSTLEQFEQVKDFFARTFHVQPDPKVPLRIVLFGSEKQFKPFQPGSFTAAFYEPGLDRDYIVMGGYSDNGDRIAVHEYVHLLVKHAGIQLPVWLNEGVAELFSTLRPVGRKVQVGDLIPGHFYAVRQEKWIPLSRLLQVNHDDPEYRGAQASVFYAESWGLTHMLQLSRDYSPRYNAFVQLVDQGRPVAEAMEFAFNKKLADVEKDLQSYFRANDRFYVRLYPLALERRKDETTSRPVSEAEANAILAGVHLNSNKHAQALALIQAAESAEPASAAAAEARAYLAWSKQDWQTAHEAFGRAIGRGASHPKLFFDAARMTMYANRRDPEAVNTMKKAIAAFPAWLEAKLELADLLLWLGRPGEAISAVGDIQRVDPANASHFYAIRARAEAALKQLTMATDSAQRALARAKTDFDRARADSLVAYIQRLARREEAELAAAALLRPAVEGKVSEGAGFIDGVERDVPAMRRAPAAAVEEEALPEVPREKREFIAGLMTMVECLGQRANLTVTNGAATARLRILEPDKVEIRGTGTWTVELTCGPQSTPVLVEYFPQAEGENAGVVRMLEMKTPQPNPR